VLGSDLLGRPVSEHIHVPTVSQQAGLSVSLDLTRESG
jgi:hypothetical protein